MKIELRGLINKTWYVLGRYSAAQPEDQPHYSALDHAFRDANTYVKGAAVSKAQVIQDGIIVLSI